MRDDATLTGSCGNLLLNNKLLPAKICSTPGQYLGAVLSVSARAGAHGVLVSIGLVWLAVALWMSRRDRTSQFRSTLEERYVDKTPFPSEQTRVGRNR